jgi:hypothetical protein
MKEKFLYRFKTIEELKNEYGEDWRGIVGFNVVGNMDFLCGTVCEVELSKERFEYNKKNDLWFIQCYYEWGINPKMLKLRIITPNYLPKKFVRDI